MATVNTYLTFNGNCEKAFKFYESVFGTQITFMGRYKDTPSEQHGMKLDPGDEEKIMHVTLPVSKETMLMACDAVGDWASRFSQGSNFSISVATNCKEESEKIFNGLSAGGNVMMPLSKTFWSECFGVLTDKFGITWMVNQN